MRIVGTVLTLVLIVLGMLSGGSLMMFINLPSVLITFGCGHAMLCTVYGKDAFAVFSPAFAESQPERGARIARAGGRLYIMAGWVGFLIGGIQMAAAIDDLRVFGDATAVLLLVILYAYAMHLLVWVPLEVQMEEKVAEKSAS